MFANCHEIKFGDFAMKLKSENYKNVQVSVTPTFKSNRPQLF